MFNKLFNLGEVFRKQCYLLIIWCWYDFGNIVLENMIMTQGKFVNQRSQVVPCVHKGAKDEPKSTPNTRGLIITLTFSLTTKQHNFGMF